MGNKTLKIDIADNIIVALEDCQQGEIIYIGNKKITLSDYIPAKHKFALNHMNKNDKIIMYGVVVGEARKDILAGERITLKNIIHRVGEYKIENKTNNWIAPDVSRFSSLSFNGYHRLDGKVGTRNYWLVIPLVFCENRNIKILRDCLLEPLGYPSGKEFTVNTDRLIDTYLSGGDIERVNIKDILDREKAMRRRRIFPNVDGIKFLTHELGCGGTRQDAESLCRLFAGYINNPNVAGATVLSLGCQNAQFTMLKKALEEFSSDDSKPIYLLTQQKSESERDYIASAVKQTFVGLTGANQIERKPAPLSKIVLGLECGGSDGFSGISANPALGYTSDMLVALGGASILSEFPELNGVEHELLNRCENKESAMKFMTLMETYNQKARASGSGFEMNPSPGNIKDGLITDAIKSAGAAKKGGTSPVVDVLDYTEQVCRPGLNLLCTPGNDVESTTAMAGSGANIMVFTTGLGTPTGNVISPTIKMSTNTTLAKKMSDFIDIDAGTIITGEHDLESKGKELLQLIIDVASGNKLTKAELKAQDDFIPWKRGVSL